MDDITNFIAGIDHKTRQADALTLLAMLQELTGYTPYLSGSIICFGQYHYQYASGHAGDAAVIAFSPRKQHLVLYIMPGFAQLAHLLPNLGKHKVGKSCLYINKLAELNLDILKEIIQLSVQYMQQTYVCNNSEHLI